MLLPVETIYHGTAKHHSSIGEVQSAYKDVLAQAGRTGKGMGRTAQALIRLTARHKSQVLAEGYHQMSRIINVTGMQIRDRMSWFVIPASALGAGFAIVWVIALLVRLFGRPHDEVFTGAVAVFYSVMLATGFGAVTGTFPFAVSYGARRRDYLLGTLGAAALVCAGWAFALTLLSRVEGEVITNWGVGLHYFHLPFFSGGTPLREFCWTSDAVCAQADPPYLHGGAPLEQLWFTFIFLLFLFLLGQLVGSVYQRFGRAGIYIALGVALLLLSVLVVVSSAWNWWGAIFGWLGQQTAAGLAWWLLPLAALFALASYALLRKATV
jgi:hypothetical protein